MRRFMEQLAISAPPESKSNHTSPCFCMGDNAELRKIKMAKKNLFFLLHPHAL